MFQAYHADFQAKRFSHLNGDAPRLVGGQASDPHATHRGAGATPRLAWLSAGGLALGQPDHARYFPLSADECIAASGFQIKQNDVGFALQNALKAHELAPPPADPGDLDRADARAYQAAKQFDRASESLGRSMVLYPLSSRGLQFLFPTESGLPRPAPAELTATLKELDTLTAASPNDRLLALLRLGLESRSKGDYGTAAEAYKQAEQICPDEASVGGICFLEAMCAMESGDLVHAAEKWQAAARTNDFSQAQYALGLSAIAYTLDGHADSINKAGAVLQLPIAKKEPMASELNQLLSSISGKLWRNHSINRDAGSESWVEVDLYNLPFASLAPVRTLDKDGKYSQRRVGIRPTTVSSVGVAGAQQPIFRIPCAITVPVIAPDKLHLAFAAAGEVFPLPPTFCDLFVLEMNGKMVVGTPSVLFTGNLVARSTVKSVTWADAGSVTISGSKVDVFGGETDYSRQVPVK